MGLKEWIIPQDKHFFNMLENESQNVLDGSNAFLDMLKNYENIKEKQQIIKDIRKVLLMELKRKNDILIVK